MINNQSFVTNVAQQYLSIVKGASIDSWMDIWAEDAVVEFPCHQDQIFRRLEGRRAIHKYYQRVASAFELREERPLVTYLSSDPRVVIYEISMKFLIRSTQKVYDQDYIGVVKVRDDGRIVFYREYFDPIRAREAFQLDGVASS